MKRGKMGKLVQISYESTMLRCNLNKITNEIESQCQLIITNKTMKKKMYNYFYNYLVILLTKDDTMYIMRA